MVLVDKVESDPWHDSYYRSNSSSVFTITTSLLDEKLVPLPVATQYSVRLALLLTHNNIQGP